MHYIVDSGILTFVNHGCEGSFNVGGTNSNWTEMTVNADHPPPKEFTETAPFYNPVLERHFRQIVSSGDYSLRDIKAGEEITNTYLGFFWRPE